MGKIVFVLILPQLLKKLVGNIKPQLSEMKAIFPAEPLGGVECRPRHLVLLHRSKLLSFFTKISGKKIIQASLILLKKNLLIELMVCEPFQERALKK
jgi:hypothetical protein